VSRRVAAGPYPHTKPGFFDFSHCRLFPLRYRLPARFETIPSCSSSQPLATTSAPSAPGYSSRDSARRKAARAHAERPWGISDSAVLDALNAADRRGVAIRIVLDPREHHDFVRLGDLADNVRIRHSGPWMRLKAYAIDGEFLRTGPANFSASGEHQQDNDLIVIRDQSAAMKFDAHFERMWDAAQPMIEFEPAIKAMEPK
jgi:hypothetical protein